MSEPKTEIQLKARATNWLLTTLIAVVSWFGKVQYETLQQISEELKNVNNTVQVHDVQINALQETARTLNGKMDNMIFKMYDKSFAKHEEFFDFPIKKN